MLTTSTESAKRPSKPESRIAATQTGALGMNGRGIANRRREALWSLECLLGGQAGRAELLPRWAGISGDQGLSNGARPPFWKRVTLHG